MKIHLTITGALAVAFMMVTMVACGGVGTSESVNYTGETMAAMIDTTSAVDLALNATLGPADDYEEGLAPLGLGSGNDSGILKIVSNPKKAFDFVDRFVSQGSALSPLSVSAEPLAEICDSDREYGDDGYVDLKICIDTGDEDWIKFEFKFVDYVDGSAYMDGKLILEGTETDLRIIFRDMVVESPVEDSYIDGWVDYVDNTVGQVVTITYNLVIIDSYGDEAYWLDDYNIEADYGNDEVTLSGNFYDFDDGYVTLTTETVLDWDLTMDVDDGLQWADHPTGGTVKLTGAEGYWISITFTSTGFYVQINYTGDTAADITLPNIGEYPWV